jgi:hypothetical protein
MPPRRRTDLSEPLFLSLPGRDPTLEQLFIVPNHSQRVGISGTTYVYYQDTTVAGLKATWAKEKVRQTPSGTLATLLANGAALQFHSPRTPIIERAFTGLVRLHEGDAVFSRSLQGSRHAEDDVIQVWVTGGCVALYNSGRRVFDKFRRVITPEMNAAFDEARDEFLGPRAKRTRTRPRKPTNAQGNRTREPLVGGIAYERSKVCKSVQEPARCYTLGPSGEAPTSIVAPVASAKMPTEEIDRDAAVRQKLLNVC